MKQVFLAGAVAAAAASAGVAAAQAPEAGLVSVALSHSGDRIALVVHAGMPQLWLGDTDADPDGFTRIDMSSLDLGRRFRVSAETGGPRAVENERWLGDVVWVSEDRLLLDVWSHARVIRARETGDFRRPVMISDAGEQIAEWPGAWELAFILPDAPQMVLVRAAREDQFAYNHSTMEIGISDDDPLFGGSSLTALSGVEIADRLVRVELPDDDQPAIRAPAIATPYGFDAAGELELAYLNSSERLFWLHDDTQDVFVFDPGEMWSVRPIADQYPPYWNLHRQPIAGRLPDGRYMPYVASPSSERVSLRALDLQTGERSDLGWDGHPDQFGGFVVDWRTSRVIGFDWLDDPETAPARIWFDPAFEDLQAQLDVRLAGARVDILDWNRAFDRVIIRTVDAETGAAWHLWDRRSETLTRIEVPASAG